jgi:pimeloyl-ACP methyl ester carboxylesterase
MLSFPERIAGRVLRATGLEKGGVHTRHGQISFLEGRGDGELPFVLLHGLSANAIAYGDLIRRILPGVSSLHAPDMPGHGYTPAPSNSLTTSLMTEAMFDALDQLITKPTVLLGNSMGGLAAVRYAAARPDKVRGLILVSPGGAPMNHIELERVLSVFKIENHREGLDFVDRIFANPPKLMRHAIAQGSRLRFAHPVMRRFINGITPDDLLARREVESLRMPTLMIWGRQEQILPLGNLEWFQRHLPERSTIEQWSDFGHIGFAERPAALARRIGLFLGELQGREAFAQHPAPSSRESAPAFDPTRAWALG